MSPAVAAPESWNSTGRENTAARKMAMPVSGAYVLNHAGAVRPRVKPNTRGIWLTAASGQMLRHRPGAVNHSSGSAGTSTPHHRSRPVSGSATSSAQTPIRNVTETIRAARQTGCGTGSGSCV